MLTLTRKDLLKRAGLPEINITTVTVLIKELLGSCHMLETREVLRGTQSLRITAVKVLTFLCISSRGSKDNTESGNPTVPESTYGPHPVPASAIHVSALLSPCLSLFCPTLSLLSFARPSPYFSPTHLPPSLPPIPITFCLLTLCPSLSSGEQTGGCPLTAKVERGQS